MIDTTAFTIAKYNLKNKFERVNATPLAWLAIAGLQIVLAGMLLSPDSSTGAIGVGEALARGEVATVSTRLTGTILSFYVLATVMSAFTWVTGGQEASPYERGFLSMTSAGNVAVGSLLESMASLFFGFFPAVIVGSLALGVAAGTPLRGAALSVVLAGLYCTTQFIGTPLGMLGQWLITHRTDSDRIESVLALGVMGLCGGTFGFSGVIGNVLATTPVRHVAAVPLAVAVPGAVPLSTALVAGAVLVAISALGLLSTLRLAGLFYLSEKEVEDPEKADDDPSVNDGRPSADVLRPVLTERQATLVGVNWTRVLRSPEVLHRAGMYVLLGLALGISAIDSPTGGQRLPAVLVLFGAIFAGQFVTLNALSDEGPRMNLWGTSPADPHDLYVSKAASTAVPMLALFGGGGLLAAVLVAEYSPLAMAAVTVLAIVGIVGSAAISTGIGFLWLSASGDDHDDDMTTPPMMLTGIHFAVIVAAVSPGLGSTLALANAVPAAETSTETLLVGLASTVVVTAGLAGFLYVTSMRKMDERHYGAGL